MQQTRRSPITSVTVCAGGPAPGVEVIAAPKEELMKQHGGEMPDVEAARVPAKYQPHVAGLVPKLPDDALRLFRHDG
jgi:hypothetical protein